MAPSLKMSKAQAPDPLSKLNNEEMDPRNGQGDKSTADNILPGDSPSEGEEFNDFDSNFSPDDYDPKTFTSDFNPPVSTGNFYPNASPGEFDPNALSDAFDPNVSPEEDSPFGDVMKPCLTEEEAEFVAKKIAKTPSRSG